MITKPFVAGCPLQIGEAAFSGCSTFTGRGVSLHIARNCLHDTVLLNGRIFREPNRWLWRRGDAVARQKNALETGLTLMIDYGIPFFVLYISV